MWTWLPAGWRVHQRWVVAIIREETQWGSGAQEMLMPVLQPAEPWRKTGLVLTSTSFSSWQDRKGSELVLAMTHEEAVTTHVAQTVRSYRDLPLILYHFQVKERDEPRPRAGVLRTREFIMKDSYSFDRAPRRGWRSAMRCISAPTTASCSVPACATTASNSTWGRWAGSAPTSTWRLVRPARIKVALALRGGGGLYAANLEVALRHLNIHVGRQRDRPSTYMTGGITFDDRAGHRDRQHLQARQRRYSEPLGAKLPG